MRMTKIMMMRKIENWVRVSQTGSNQIKAHQGSSRLIKVVSGGRRGQKIDVFGEADTLVAGHTLRLVPPGAGHSRRPLAGQTG